MSFELQEDDGYRAEYRNTPAGPPPRGFPAGPNDGSIDKEEDIKSILLTAKIFDFNVLAQTYKSETNGIIRFDTALSLGDVEYVGEMFHVDYNINTNELEFQFFADYNKFYFNDTAPNSNTFGTVSSVSFSDDGKNNTRTRFGARANWQFHENADLLFGAETEERATSDFTITSVPSGELQLISLEEQENNEFSAYAQIDYKIKSWRLLVGGRYTDNGESGEDVTPRFSIVKNLNKNSSLKLLHSVGFNSPNLIQSGINIPGTVISDEDVSAETITSSEFAYSYKKGNFFFVGNLFYTELEDLIGREPTGNGNENRFANSEELNKRYGFELDSQFVINRFKVYANFSYLDQGNQDLSDEGDADSFFSPKFTLYSGLSYQFDAKQSFGGSAKYLGERNDFDSQFIVSLNYTYRSKNNELYVTVGNVTSEKIINADAGLRILSDIPSADTDANLTLGYRYIF